MHFQDAGLEPLALPSRRASAPGIHGVIWANGRWSGHGCERSKPCYGKDACLGGQRSAQHHAMKENAIRHAAEFAEDAFFYLNALCGAVEASDGAVWSLSQFLPG